MLYRDQDSIRETLAAQRALMEAGQPADEFLRRWLHQRELERRRSDPHPLHPTPFMRHSIPHNKFNKDDSPTFPTGRGLPVPPRGTIEPPAPPGTSKAALDRLRGKAKPGKGVPRPRRSKPPKEESKTPEERQADDRREFPQRAAAWDRDKMDTEKVVSPPYRGKYGSAMGSQKGPASPVGMSGRALPAFRQRGAELLRRAGGEQATGVAMPHSMGRQLRRAAQGAAYDDDRTVFTASVDLGRTPLLIESQ